MHNSLILNLGLVCTSLFFCNPLLADVILIFEPSPGNGENVNQSYGDNVSGSTVDGFCYEDTDGKFTPNVQVEYGDSDFDFRHWDSSFGDLFNVLFRHQSGDLTAKITFQAEPGYGVLLHSFEMAGWPQSDYIIDAVAVLDVCNVPMFELTDVSIIGNTNSSPDHTTFEFEPPLQSSRIQILFDSSNLGSDVDNIGIDNIRFSQVVMPGTGDVNQDGSVDLLDVAPFVDLLTTGQYQIEADVNEDGALNLLDVSPFVDRITCGG